MPARYGNLAFKAQIAFFRGKVSVPTAHWADVWQGAHDQAFMVAGAAKAELIDDLRKAVGKGIEQGTTLAQFRKDFDAIVARHGWTGWTGEGSEKGRAWRTRVIYETNLRTSYAAGRWEQLQAGKHRRPWLMYVHDDSVRYPRPHHQAWDGTVLHIDDPWWQAHYPPNGWGCKCKVRSLTRGQLQRRGLTPGPAPESPIDPKTGAPEGIDAGWAYAPGASRPQQLAANLRGQAPKLPPDIKRRLLDDIDAALGNGPGKPPTPPAPGAPPSPGGPGLPPAPTAPVTVRQAGAAEAQRFAIPPATLSPTFSTVKGVTGEAIEDVLRRIPGAAPQVAKLEAFLRAHPVKTLVLKQAEMGAGGTATKLAPKVGKFLDGDRLGDLDEFRAAARYRSQYTIRRNGRVNGFTSVAYEHIVVKSKAADDLSRVLPEELAQAVEHAIGKAALGDRGSSWSIRAALDERTGGRRPGMVSTWAHELGHQVHFWAGAPDRLRNAASITTYSRTNKYEWHAEHLAAWLFNRDALANWSPEIAAYLDDLIDRATRSTHKAR